MPHEPRYSPSFCLTAKDKVAIHGPGEYFGAHAGYCSPDILFDDTDEGRAMAARVCGLLERAYAAGSAARLRSIQSALGI